MKYTVKRRGEVMRTLSTLVDIRSISHIYHIPMEIFNFDGFIRKI